MVLKNGIFSGRKTMVVPRRVLFVIPSLVRGNPGIGRILGLTIQDSPLMVPCIEKRMEPGAKLPGGFIFPVIREARRTFLRRFFSIGPEPVEQVIDRKGDRHGKGNRQIVGKAEKSA